MKQQINEIRRMQQLAGLITESEYRESSSPSYLFIGGDNELELDKDEFKKYILSNIDKIKTLWNTTGGNWESDNITQDEINKAIEIFWRTFPKNMSTRIDTSVKNPSQYYLDSWDKNEEESILSMFLDTLQDTINS